MEETLTGRTLRFQYTPKKNPQLEKYSRRSFWSLQVHQHRPSSAIGYISISVIRIVHVKVDVVPFDVLPPSHKHFSIKTTTTNRASLFSVPHLILFAESMATFAFVWIPLQWFCTFIFSIHSLFPHHILSSLTFQYSFRFFPFSILTWYLTAVNVQRNYISSPCHFFRLKNICKSLCLTRKYIDNDFNSVHLVLPPATISFPDPPQVPPHLRSD